MHHPKVNEEYNPVLWVSFSMARSLDLYMNHWINVSTAGGINELKEVVKIKCIMKSLLSIAMCNAKIEVCDCGLSGHCKALLWSRSNNLFFDQPRHKMRSPKLPSNAVISMYPACYIHTHACMYA